MSSFGDVFTINMFDSRELLVTDVSTAWAEVIRVKSDISTIFSLDSEDDFLSATVLSRTTPTPTIMQNELLILSPGLKPFTMQINTVYSGKQPVEELMVFIYVMSEGNLLINCIIWILWKICAILLSKQIFSLLKNIQNVSKMTEK